jgi:hypothetical protein
MNKELIFAWGFSIIYFLLDMMRLINGKPFDMDVKYHLPEANSRQSWQHVVKIDHTSIYMHLPGLCRQFLDPA